MKVLLLNGSPRGEGSGTLKLARAFLEGLQDACGAEVETVHLIEKKILPCRGCFGCWTGTPGRCVQRDDMDGLLPRYRQAELVVWCLPLYYFGMPSHAKAFLDRLLPSNLPRMEPRPQGGMGHPPRWPETRCQRHLLISTCGFCARQNNYEALEKQFEIAFGGEEGRLTQILCPEGELFRVPQLRGRTDAYLALLREAGSGVRPRGPHRPRHPRRAGRAALPAGGLFKNGRRQLGGGRGLGRREPGPALHPADGGPL